MELPQRIVARGEEKHTPDAIIYSEGDTAYSFDEKRAPMLSGSVKDVIEQTIAMLPSNSMVVLKGVFKITEGIVIPQSCALHAEGAVFRAHATTTAARMIQPDSNVSLELNGLEFDLQNRWGVATGSEITRSNTSLTLRNCVLKNVANYGISLTAPNSTLIISNTTFHAAQDSNNELVLTENASRVHIINSKLSGNKPIYLSADTVNISQCEISAAANSTQSPCIFACKKLKISSTQFDSTSPYIYPHGDVHLNNVYSSAELVLLQNLTLLESAAGCRITLKGYNSTYGFKQVKISNVLQQKTPISIAPFGTEQSFIEQLTISDVLFKEYSAAPQPVSVEDHNINSLVVKAVHLPPGGAVNSSYISLNAKKGNITVNAHLRNIFSDATLSYCAELRDDGASGYAISGTLDITGLQLRPLRLATSSVVDNMTIKQSNSGIATFSGDGTTTQFSIAHGLSKVPTAYIVTPASADAAGISHVTADASNLYVNYSTAPPAGTNNVKLSWFAQV